MKVLKHILEALTAPALLLAAFLLASACDGHKNDVGEGTGTVKVNISYPVEMETRHATGEGSDASDGGIMNNLTVWLVQNGGAFTFTKQSVTTPKAATATVEFKDVARGDYILLIAANYTGLDGTYTEGTAMDDYFWPTLIGEIAAGQSPSFNDTYGMPLSFQQSISVAAGENVIDASLRRCVGRLTFNVRNNLDDYELFIHSIGLSDYNNTQGKLWESKGIGTTMVAFPDLPDMDQDGDGQKDGLVQVGPREVKNIYDIYLYGTNPNPEANFTFDMLAALFPKNTPASKVKVSSRELAPYEIQGNSTDFDSSGKYMLRSALNSNIYLGDTGTSGSGSLVATSLESDTEIKALANITNYFWKLTSSSSWGYSYTTIQNVVTGNYLTISSSGILLSNSSSRIYYESNQSSQTLKFYAYPSGWSAYYLSFNGTNITYSNSSNSNDGTNWTVRPVKAGESGTIDYFDCDDSSVKFVEIPRNDRIIKYLDIYGASQPLTKISRNEHVTVNINVFYNRELSEFQFEVLDWDDGGSHETTFD